MPRSCNQTGWQRYTLHLFLAISRWKLRNTEHRSIIWPGETLAIRVDFWDFFIGFLRIPYAFWEEKLSVFLWIWSYLNVFSGFCNGNALIWGGWTRNCPQGVTESYAYTVHFDLIMQYLTLARWIVDLLLLISKSVTSCPRQDATSRQWRPPCKTVMSLHWARPNQRLT